MYIFSENCLHHLLLLSIMGPYGQFCLLYTVLLERDGILCARAFLFFSNYCEMCHATTRVQILQGVTRLPCWLHLYISASPSWNRNVKVALGDRPNPSSRRVMHGKLLDSRAAQAGGDFPFSAPSSSLPRREARSDRNSTVIITYNTGRHTFKYSPTFRYFLL